MDKRKKHFAKLIAEEIRSKPPTKAQKRNQMSIYLKNMAGYKHTQLKNKSYDEIQKLFNKEMKRVNSFVPMDSEVMEGSGKKAESSGKEAVSKKRAGEKLDEESVKRQKVEDDAEKAELKACLEIVPKDAEAVNVESLAIKYPIVDWKTHILAEDKMYYEIIRADGSTKYYKIFNARLDDFDRQDVLDLYRLVLVDLVVHHLVQVDVFRTENALKWENYQQLKLTRMSCELIEDRRETKCRSFYWFTLVFVLDQSGALRHDIHYWLGKDTSQDEAGAATLKTVELDAALEGHSFQYLEVSVNNGLLLSMLFELHVAFCYWLGILNNGILSAGSVILRGILTTPDSIDQDRVIIVAPAELEAFLLSHSEILDAAVITFKYYKAVSELQQKKDGGMFINSFYIHCQTWISETCHARNTPRINNKKPITTRPSVFKRLKKNNPLHAASGPRKEGGVFNRLGRKEPATSARPDSRQRSPQAKRTEVEARRRQQKGTASRTTSQYSESEDSEGGHWKSKSRRQRSNTYEDDLSQPWTCEERNPFTPRIRHFSLPRTRMPSHVKTYDGSGDPEDHLKLFQSAAKTEGWAMPTWCHMFNSTLTGNARVWFDKLPKESIDSYEDLRTSFRENYLQQTKHIKDPVEIHHIKQRDGESTEDFMERYKAEVLDVEGAPECMKISGFMHRITHPGLIKHLYERIPRSMDEMYRMTTSFLQGEVAAFSHGRRKAPSSWKPKDRVGSQIDYHSSQKCQKKFSLWKKESSNLHPQCTDECMQLRKQIDEMIKAGKLSQFIRELKQNDKSKAPKKGKHPRKRNNALYYQTTSLAPPLSELLPFAPSGGQRS
ncbi:reverse transcriptase domain-containing protein [Tanacetum coccineum]